MGWVTHSLQSHLLVCSNSTRSSGDRSKVMQLGTKSVSHPHRTRGCLSESSGSEKVSGVMITGIIQLHRSSQCYAAAKCASFDGNMQ